MQNELMRATREASARGMITAQQTNELMTVLSFNWLSLLDALPALAVFFPALAPILPWIKPIITFIQGLINGSVLPIPLPLPSPTPNGGDEQPPTPVIR